MYYYVLCIKCIGITYQYVAIIIIIINIIISY